MRLSKNDVELFYKLYHPLLVYVNEKCNIVKDLNSTGDFKKTPLKEINEIRHELYKRPELIDAFVAANPLNFSPNELTIVKGWKDFVNGRFIILRYLKNYTIFLSDDEPARAYGVFALNTTFEEMLGARLPVMIEAVLLPFNDKIIYDSIFAPYSVHFGGGIRRGFNEAYQKAKLRFGIITSLPFSAGKDKLSDADKLRFYLRSERNRHMYCEEIENLIGKDQLLLTLYHQEMGKIHAKMQEDRLRKLGLSTVWFAMLEGIIVASGTTKDNVEETLQQILPAEKRRFVYIFQVKGKG